MAPYGFQQAHHPGARHGPHGGGYAPQAMPSRAPPPGTFSPGTKIQVGSHRVVIQKYLSEGGFAHVYLVKLLSPVDAIDLAVLKRVAVPDKESLRGMRTEVETMKRLKGHRPIVTYIDSHASELKGGGYEVFLLMEFCDGGGLIDFMNTRLQHRLTEPEILHIFADVAEGVACMHYLTPPLLHRDLKVENVLIVNQASSKRFKVCDFGSAAPPSPAPTTVVECRLMDEDVQKHTTLQYRAPEMVDTYRKQPLNEKSDIWALGVFLYKLCYYTTPFEDQGQLAILNASFKYPSHPMFSDRLKKLIGSMLRENMASRPNIYQVLKEACDMQGRTVPIQDIYSGQAHRESRNARAPSLTKADQPELGVVVGAVYSPPTDSKPNLPDIVPMRRGRPTASLGPQEQNSSARKVTEGDPFAALDAKNATMIAEADELSSRFPTLDQFALLHDKGVKFDFDSSATSPEAQPMSASQHIADHLADEAPGSLQISQRNSTISSRSHSVTPGLQHVQHNPSPPVELPTSKAPSAPEVEHVRVRSASSSTNRKSPDLKAKSIQTGSNYVSTGTMTSDFSVPAPTPQSDTRYVPAAQERVSSRASPDVLPLNALPPHLRRPSLSSRPSLEDSRRQAHVADSTRLSATYYVRPRPASTSFDTSTLQFLREKELEKSQKSFTQNTSQSSKFSEKAHFSPRNASAPQPPSVKHNLLIDVDNTISISRDKLPDVNQSMQSSEGTASRTPNKRNDAFNRLENNSAQIQASLEAPSSPKKGLVEAMHNAQATVQDAHNDQNSKVLTDKNDNDSNLEMRRELERRKLEEEEKRVAAAQAEYKSRVVSSGKPVPGPKNVGGASRAASSIQKRVHSLLNEEQKPATVQRTAQGYGRYTKDPSLPLSPTSASSTIRKSVGAKPSLAAIPSNGAKPTNVTSANANANAASSRATRRPPEKAAGSKPPAPKKKPTHLNSFPTGGRPQPPIKQVQKAQSELRIAVDIPGQPVREMSAQDKTNYIKDFTKRFPSLSSIEMESQRGRVGGSRQ